MTDQCLTRAELAKKWGVHPNTIKNYAIHQGLPEIRMTKKCVRYRMADVLAFERNRRMIGGQP